MMKIYGQVCFKMSTSVITANLIWTKVCHRLEERDVRVGGVWRNSERRGHKYRWNTVQRSVDGRL